MSATLIAAILAAAVGKAAAQQNLGNLYSPNFTAIGQAEDPVFGYFESDGGAAGFLGGQQLVSLSDPGQIINGNYVIEAHTGMAVLNSIDETGKTPPQVTVSYNKASKNFWNGGFIGEVSEDEPGFAPAPHVAPVPIPGSNGQGVGVYPIHPNEHAYRYNTMFTIDMSQSIADHNAAGTQIPTNRVKPVLFNVTGPNAPAGYGSEALVSDTGANPQFLYLFEADSTGLKVARAPWSSYADTTSWGYWDGQNWGKTPMRYNQDAQANILTHDSSTPLPGERGTDVRYSSHFGTWILTYASFSVPYSDMLISYSTTGRIEGPYAQPKSLFTPVEPQTCPYGTQHGTNFPQIHWDWFGADAGRALVSWVSCYTAYTSFGIVDWS